MHDASSTIDNFTYSDNMPLVNYGEFGKVSYASDSHGIDTDSAH